MLHMTLATAPIPEPQRVAGREMNSIRLAEVVVSGTASLAAGRRNQSSMLRATTKHHEVLVDCLRRHWMISPSSSKTRCP